MGDPAEQVHPGAQESVADGIDQDCDGYEVCPLDPDGDGYAGITTGLSADQTRQTAPFTTVVGDCDDSEALASPDGLEIPGDGIDNDCVDGDAPLMTLQGPLPGAAGTVNGLIADNASPGGRIAFVVGGANGMVHVPGCPGLTVPLRGPYLLGTRVADATGHAELSFFVPSSVAGVRKSFVAVDLDACMVSNVNARRL
ncbi:MAG: putative metal-binding motif-containing protein [Alphaproteobacteria bacterium]|nr:putative metal-binding motif-containing protein [Alphaproteobacteria bacterium]